MDSIPSLRRKATSLLSSENKVDLTVKKRKSLTSSLSSSLSSPLPRTSSLLPRTSSSLPRTSSKVVKTVKMTTVKTVLHSLKPVKLRKNPTRERRKPKVLQDEPVKDMKKAVHATNNDRSKLRFLRLSYLTVRNEEDSFFLCRALQNVYAHTKSFRVQWLTFDPKTQLYRVDYLADISPDSVLTTVRLNRVGAGEYELREADRLETERLLKKSINKDKGLDVSDEESDEEEEPPAKKAKKGTKKTTKTLKKEKKEKKETKERKPRAKKEKAEKAPRKRKISKKNEDLELHPNPAIKVLDKDPFFETKDKVTFVSKFVHGKLIIRAVLLNDMKMLKKLSQDRDKVYTLNSTRAPAIPLTALEYAVLTNNATALKTLMDIEKDPSYQKARHREQIMIDRLGTGSYNRRSLGVSFIREIMASRGTREGNNALTKDVSDMRTNCRPDNWKLLRTAFQNGCDWKFVKTFMEEHITPYCYTELEHMPSHIAKSVFKEIVKALWRGHHKLAGQLLKFAAEHTTSGYQQIHAMVLLEDVKAMKKINPGDVTISSSAYPGCTPIHIAAVNPDPQVLKHLLNLSPDINCNDQMQKNPVHYAAVCESTGPLELLLKMGASSLSVDKEKNSPLHMACEAGRYKNVDVLLGANPDLKSAQGEIVEQRYGKGGINRVNRFGYQPIHLAAENGHQQVVKVLLKHGVDINAQLSIGKFRLTPLMLATDQGHYDLVKYLVDNGAVVKQRDRLGRTALIHAVMNGHTHIASYLLNLGADPNTADSSINTAIHYAAAYGWPHLTRLLLEAGADPNMQSLWKLSPVSIAWFKGHRGIVSILLEDERVDVNFRDDKGQTLVHIAASSPLAKDLYDQMQYLIEEKGGDATVVSLDGDTALTLLVSAPRSLEEEDDTFEMCEERRRKIAELLLKHGCPIDTVKKSGESVLDLTIKKHSSLNMIKFLVDQGASISEQPDDNGDNLLHHVCRDSMEFTELYILEHLVEKTPAKGTDNGTDFLAILKSMVNQVNHQGFTPLLLACQQYGRHGYASGKDDKERRLWWRKKREFLKFLVERLGADVSAVVGMRQFEGDKDVPERQRYGPYGKHSVLDLLMDANDMSDPDGPWGAYPAIRLMLDYHADPNTRSVDGKTPLCKAIRKGHPDLVAMLLEHGADVNIGETDEEGNVIRTPLMEAISYVIKEGVVKTLKLMLKKGARINEKLPKTGESALHKVVTLSDDARQVMLMKAILSFGPDLDVRDNNDRTPLHLAVNKNRGSINTSNFVEEMLIDHGADVFAKDKQSRMPIAYVFSRIDRENDRSNIDPAELCRLLAAAMNFKQLDHQDCNGQTVLHLAAFRGAYLSTVYLLQKAPYLKVSQGDKTGTSALGYAVRNNYDNYACMLIQHEPAAVSVPIVTMPTDQPTTKKTSEESDMSDDDDVTSDDSDFSDSDSDSDSYRRKREEAKHRAAENKKERPPKPIWIWKPLKKKEKATGIVKTSVFQAAIKQELQGTVFMILELPQSVSDLTNFKAIEIAIGARKDWVALRLMSRIRDKAEFKLTNDDGQNFFHIMALKWSKHFNEQCFSMITDLLLEHDVRVDQKDKYGCTPIFYAAYNHNFKMTDFFLSQQKKLDASVKDKFGRTLVAATLLNWKAAMNDEWNVGVFLNKLYTHKAVLDDRFDFPGGIKMFGSNLPEGDISYFTEGSGPLVSPLIQAILTDNFSFAQYLLKSRASVNYTDAAGIYPLMHAVRQNDVKLVKLMLDHNYDPVIEQRTIDEEKRKAREKAEKKKALAKSKAQKFSLKRVATVQSEDSDAEKSESEDEDENKEEEEDETSRYRAVAKKSKVNLNAQDKSGWTALHHCVRPLTLGTFDNAEIVWTLAKAGANLNIKDKEGRTLLDMALKNGAFKIAKVIQEILKVDEKKQKQPVLEAWPAVDDRLVWNTPAPDVEKDAAALLQKLAENNMEVDTPALQEDIDDQCEIKATGELVTDKELKRPFSALLTKVDIKQGMYGMYNFYKLQLVRQKGKDMYVLFTRWGRIGDRGQFQHTPFASLEEAVKEFQKVYREKSGNHWADRNGEFEAKYNKYRLVTLDEEHPGVKQDQVKVNLTSKIPSKLPHFIQDTMREFTSVENLNAAMRREIDVELLPFGRLKKEDLLAAKKVLVEVGQVLNEADEMAKNLADEDKEKYWHKRDQVSRLSSQFYQLIPKKNFVYEKIRPLDKSEIQAQMRVVNNLLDYEKASKIILGAEYRKKEINPLDYVYRALNCKIRLLKEDDEMTQYLLQYISASDSNANVEAIYSVSRDGEEPSNLDNQKLLFHGSGVPNFIGILNQGLLVAPPGVQLTGALFGEGIYTSHAFRKSKGYCYNYVSGSRLRYMLLCQVALGKPDHSYRGQDGPRPGFDSVVKCCPDFQFEVKLPSGVSLPLDHTGYSNSEFIVYKPDQVVLRYLIQFRT